MLLSSILAASPNAYVTNIFLEFLAMFMNRFPYFIVLFKKQAFFTFKLFKSLLMIICRNHTHLDQSCVNDSKVLRDLLILKAMGKFENNADKALHLMSKLSSWPYASFLSRLILSKRPLSKDQAMILIMTADTFLYVNADVSVTSDKLRSIRLPEDYSNYEMLQYAKYFFNDDFLSKSNIVSDLAQAFHEVPTSVVRPHYTLGKSGVFGAIPLSFLIDFYALENNQDMRGCLFSLGSELQKIKGNPEILGVIKGSDIVNRTIITELDSYFTSLSSDLKDISKKDIQNLKKAGLEGTFTFENSHLEALFISMSSMAFGTVKSRFKSLLKDRSLIPNKFWPDLTTLSRNYAGLEKCWKFRNILIINLYIQQTLIHIHDVVFSVLKRCPYDLTYNQNEILEFLTKNENSKMISLDLTDATTQQHTSIMETVLSYTVSERFGRLFIQIVKEYLLVHFNNDGEIFSSLYTSGTAQGTRSIWGLFVIAHHLIIQKAFEICGLKANYRILGDNIIFVDPFFNPALPVDGQTFGVTYEYIRLSGIFNGSFSHDKSWYPTADSINPCTKSFKYGVEFAKRYIYDSKDITPLALNFFLTFENISANTDNFVKIYNSFVSGCCDFLILHLIPRLGYKNGDGSRIIINSLKFMLIKENELFDRYNATFEKFLGYILCYQLDKYSFKAGKWSQYTPGIVKLLATLNSFMVNEYGYNSYFKNRFVIVGKMLNAEIQTSKILCDRSIPFKFGQLPEVFYLNYLNLKTHQIVRGSTDESCRAILPYLSHIPSLPQNLRLNILSTLAAYNNHPLINLCRHVEQEYNKMQEALEKANILLYAISSTLDIRYLSPLLELGNVTSKYIDTKSSFGLDKRKSDRGELHKNHPLQEFNRNLVTHVHSDSFYSSITNLNDLRILSYQWINSHTAIGDKGSCLHTEIMIRAHVLLQDFYPSLRLKNLS